MQQKEALTSCRPAGGSRPFQTHAILRDLIILIYVDIIYDNYAALTAVVYRLELTSEGVGFIWCVHL